MKTTRILGFLIFSLIPAATLAQGTCATVFTLSEKNRPRYVQELRDFDGLRARAQRPAIADPAQNRADFERRILKHLFVETSFFMRLPYSKTLEVPKTDEAWIQQRLLTIKNLVSNGLARENAVSKLASDFRMKPERAREILETLDQIEERPREAASFLSQALARSYAQAVKAEQHQSAANAAKGVGYWNKRNRAEMKWPTILGGLGTWIAGTSTTALTLTAFGHGPGSDMGLLIFPVFFGSPFLGGWLSHNAMTKIAPIQDARRIYHNFQSRRLTKDILKDVRRLSKEMEPVPVDVEKKESTDEAFDKAWDEWTFSVQQAEANRNKANMDLITGRMSQVGLVLQPTRFWELPNGERFADAAKDQTLLTPERDQRLRSGFQLKDRQLDLMLKEIDWILFDLNRADAVNRQNGARLNDETLLAAQSELTEGIRQNLTNLRGLIESRQDQLRFAEAQRSAGEAAFRRYVNSMNNRSPR